MKRHTDPMKHKSVASSASRRGPDGSKDDVLDPARQQRLFARELITFLLHTIRCRSNSSFMKSS